MIIFAHKRLAVVATAMLLTAACGGGDGAGNGDGGSQAYQIDISGHISGNGSDFYASRVEGLRVYLEDLNSRGGINGRQVELRIRDNGGDPTTAASQAQEASDGDALLTILSSASSTIQPFAAVTMQTQIPSFYLGPCYPPAAGPDGAPNWFCVGPNPITDSNAMLDFYFEEIVPEYNLEPAPAYVSSDAPGNQAVFEELIRPEAEAQGAAEGGYLTRLPFSQGDFGSAANAIESSGADSVISYTIPTQQNGVAAALLARDFEGPYLMLGNSPGTQAALERMKDPSVYSVEWTAPFSEQAALHKDIEASADKYGASGEPADLTNGWVLGMMLEAAITQCGEDCSREGLIEAIDDGVALDSDELKEVWGPTPPEWNAETHTTVSKDYVLVHYDADAKEIVRTTDWVNVPEGPFAFPE